MIDGIRVTVELPPETVEQIVDEVVRQVLASHQPPSHWLCGAQAAAEYLDWPVSRIYRNLRRLPHSRDGRRLMFHTGQLDQFLAEQTEP